MSVQPLFDETFLRRLDRLMLVSRRARAGQLKGERRSPKRGQSIEFADYRPYTPGDDFRQIDWNVYARLERFYLKLFVEEEDLTVHLLVDTSESMDWGEPNKLWTAARLAGALGYIALAGLDRVTAFSFGGAPVRTAQGASVGKRRVPSVVGTASEVFPARRRRESAPALFAFLQNLEGSGTTRLRDHLRRYAGGARNPGPLLLVSDLLDPDWQDGLRALLARRFDITVLHVLAPDELEPALSGDLRLRDVETGAALEVTIDEALLERYRTNVRAWQGEVRSWCHARGINYVLSPTNVSVEEVVLRLLRRRGVLR